MIKQVEVALFRVYCCNCGDLFSDRESLTTHIRNKKKGKYRDKHYGGDFVSGNKIGLIKQIKCFSERRMRKTRKHGNKGIKE